MVPEQYFHLCAASMPRFLFVMGLGNERTQIWIINIKPRIKENPVNTRYEEPNN